MDPTNPFTLQNKTVLVTGASSGIGKAIAITCASFGATMILCGRNKERLEDTFQQLQGEGHQIVLCDLATEPGIDHLVGSLQPLDGVVHSAGIQKRFPLKFITQAALEELMHVNFFAPALLSQKLHRKKLLKKESSIVFISSVASSYASLGNIMYMASKGAINSFMKGIAFELAASRIRANAIQPGMIRTNLTVTIPDEEIQKDIARYPLGRYGNPEEVAFAAVYLLSDATKWMTGSLLTIDGGLTLR